MKQKHLFFTIVLFLMISVGMLAQQITVKGTVSEASGEKLLGVNVQVKGTTVFSTTDMDGKYEIKAQDGAILIFSYIGLDTKEVTVKGKTLDVVLTESAQKLDEVVITSLGIKRQKGSLGYATQEVKGNDIADAQRDNFITALQGRVAGLDVTSTTGDPGASATIRLRGVNSMSGNNTPLYVVDGLPINNSTLDQGLLISNGANRGADYTNRGADINPDDIESVTILKGPEAAALYGIDAANGAIIITTKKGQIGKGKITFSSDTGLSQIYRLPETQNVYQRGASGISNVNYLRHFGEKYAPGTVLYDNINNFFQTGFKQSNALSFESGNETLTYRLSLSNLKQNGVVPTTSYKKLNISLAGSAKINEKVSSTTSIMFTKADNDKASKGANGYLLNLLTYPLNEDVTNYLNPNGTRRYITDGSTGTEVDNPFFDLNKNKANDKNSRVIANVSMMYDPFEWLNFTVRFGADANATQGYSSLHPESQRSPTLGLGKFEEYSDQSKNFNYLFIGTIKKSMGKFNGLLRVGATRKDDNYRISSTSGERYYMPNMLTINNTDPTTQRTRQRTVNRRLEGIFAETTLDYDQILYLTLTGRNDVSSTLPRANNSFFYPSASLSFVFTNLKVFKGKDILSYGKLRAAHSKVGNDAKPYSILPFYEPAVTTGGGFTYGFTGANPNLKAEMNISTEIGTELRFLKNRIGLDFSVYRRKTDNSIINNMRLSYGTGFILSSMNFGSLQNEGMEITLLGSPVKKTDFSWDLMLNFTKTRSELLSLPPTLPEYYTSDTWLAGNVRGGARVGSSLTAFTGYTYLRNNNGDILINPSNGQPVLDQTFPIIGDRNPDFVIGFQNSFTHKNLKLTLLLDIRKGGDVYNATERYLWINGLSVRTLDREQPLILKGVLRDGLENTATPTINNIQVTPYYQNEYYNVNLVDSDFIEKDINWLRMRDITLSYSFPADIITKTKLFESLSMYMTVTDAFMITNYTGADPSVNGLNASSGGAGGTGFDYGVISNPRGMNFGVKFGL